MAINLNEHEGQKDRELIPSGTKAILKLGIIPPEANYKSTISPALTHKNDDVHFMNCEIEVMTGKYKGRKFWQNFTVAGGKKDASGKSIPVNISMAFLRSAWDAFNQLRPDDMSQNAVQKRQISDYAEFHGMTFPAIICEKEGDPGYNNKNEIYQVIGADKPEYKTLMEGGDVEPANIGIIKSKKKGNGAAKTEAAKPAWATGAATPAPAEPAGSAGGFPAAAPAAPATDLRPAWARG